MASQGQLPLSLEIALRRSHPLLANTHMIRMINIQDNTDTTDEVTPRDLKKWPLQMIPRTARKSAIFTRFSDLPTEVRLKIWRFALPGPRRVTVILKMEDIEEGNEEEKAQEKKIERLCDKYMGRSISDSAKPPTLLGVCSESREIALRTYSLCFIKTSKREPEGRNASGIFIDNQIDTVELLSQCHATSGHNHGLLYRCHDCVFVLAIQRYTSASLASIRNLTFQHTHLLFPGSRTTGKIIELLNKFSPHLERLDLNIHKHTRPNLSINQSVEEMLADWDKRVFGEEVREDNGFMVIKANVAYWNVAYSVRRCGSSGFGIEASIVRDSASRCMVTKVSFLDWVEMKDA